MQWHDGRPSRDELYNRFRSLTLEELECREDDADTRLREILGPERFAQHMLNKYGDMWLNYVLNKNRQAP